MLKLFIRYIILIFVIQLLHLSGGFAQIDADTLNVPVLARDTATIDTLQAPKNNATKDTTSQTTTKGIKSEVDYQSADTIESFLNKKLIYLKGKAEVKFEDITLNAEYIEIDFNKNELFAYGREDSLGNITGRPVFTQGEDNYESKSIRYNFKSKKGIITDVVTEKEGGFLHSNRTKMHSKEIIDLKSGKYTTCNHEHPHYYIAMSKARVIQDDKIVSGPLYLVIADVPTPVFIPFAFFPFTKEKTSGLIIPGFGESQTRGFAMEDLGYYWAINDYMDLKVLGSIYSKGSFKVSLGSNYKKRYRFGGKVNLEYEKIIESEEGLSDYVNTNSYAFTWHHRQDPKARPNSDFSANVNLRSTSSNRYSTEIDRYLQNTVNSSINYSHDLPGTPFSLNGQVSHTLNTRDSTVSMVLPSLNINMKRIMPFESKNSSKPPNFFEKIGITYQSRFENSFTVAEDELFQEDVVDEFKYGVRHDIGASSSAKFLKHFNFSPRINYNERWYFNSLRKKYEESLFVENDTLYTYGKTITDTISGFNRVYDYNAGASVNTTIYGLYTFKPFIPVEALRFVHTPSVGYIIRPDFRRNKYGYYDYVEGVPDQQYSYYENYIYGVPGGPRSGSIDMRLSNQISMKVRTPKDTASESKKVDLLKTLNFSTNYNIEADSMNWAPLNIRASTNLFKKINVQFSATADPYALDPITFQRIDKFQYNVNNKIARLTNVQFSTGFKIDSKIFEGDEGGDEETEKEDQPYDYYDYFDIPWSFNVNYKYSYSKPLNEVFIKQTVRVNGNFSVTEKWKIGFNTHYDFENRKFGATSINVSRDLHCWIMTFNWIPFGNRQSYSFTIGVKSAILKDLKYDQRNHWRDNTNY